MSDLPKLAHDIPFSIGGKEYTFSKFTLGSFAEFITTMKHRETSRAIKALGNVGAREKVEVLRELSCDLDDPRAFEKWLQSFEGILLALWLCLRKNHPDLTEQALGEILELDDLLVFSDFITKTLLTQEEPGEDDGSKNPPEEPPGG